MRLVLDPWPDGEVTVAVEASIPMPPDPAAVGRRWLAAELPPGATVRASAPVELVTRDGWPVVLLEARVHDAAGQPGAARLVALYRLLDHLAAVRVEASAAWLATHRAEVTATLLAATAAWSDEPVALAQWWRD